MPDYLYYFLAIAVIAILIFALTKIKIKEYLPYEKTGLLTPYEYKFYNFIKDEAEKLNYIICPKVRLADICKSTDKEIKHFNKISAKHLDFLICDKNLKPIFVIELDDKSHLSAKAKANDEFKNKVLNKIGLPLKRITTGKWNQKLLEEIFTLTIED